MKESLLLIAALITACSSSKKETPNQLKPTPLEKMESPAARGASLPFLTRGVDNILYHSWVEKSKDTSMLKYAKYVNDEWTIPTTIASGSDWFVNWADYPMISQTTKGMIAHFLAKSSAGTYSYDVNLVTENNGNWSDSFVPHTDGTPTEHGFVTMLPMTDSTFQVAWLDGRNTGSGDHGDQGHGVKGAMTLRTALVGLDGSVVDDVLLDNKTCDCCQTTGAITSEGPIIVYRDRSELEIRDMYIVRKQRNGWSKPIPISQDNWNIAGCPVNGPSADAIGNTLGVVWFTAANDQPKVKVIFSDDAGRSFGEATTIDNKLPLGRVDLIMLDTASAMVSWLTKEGDFTLIKVRKVYANGSMDAPIVISQTSDSRGSGFPQMEKVGDQVYFSWTALDGEGSFIKMAKMNL